MYIYQKTDWPAFTWNSDAILPVLSIVRNKQGRLLGKIGSLGFDLRNQANLEILTTEVLKSTEIEGEILDKEQVRSSVARRLGLEINDSKYSDRNVDGMVDLMIDATSNFEQLLTEERLFSWHSALFPSGKSGLRRIATGNWRNDSKGPMQVVSGILGREKVHFQAPEAIRLGHEVRLFLDWFNFENNTDQLIKAAIAHLWFVTIHPFEDGNGRISRAVSEMLLARSDEQSQRFYSMSSQIRKERSSYYQMLETTQKGTLDVTEWIDWFLKCLFRAIESSDHLLEKIIYKHTFWVTHANTDLNDRQRKMINLLLDNFEGVLNTTKWSRITKCSPDTALRDIQELIILGILAKSRQGGRSTSYEMIRVDEK